MCQMSGNASLTWECGDVTNTSRTSSQGSGLVFIPTSRPSVSGEDGLRRWQASALMTTLSSVVTPRESAGFSGQTVPSVFSWLISFDILVLILERRSRHWMTRPRRSVILIANFILGRTSSSRSPSAVPRTRARPGATSASGAKSAWGNYFGLFIETGRCASSSEWSTIPW